MNNNNSAYSGERLSFYKLFKDKKFRISIPIIQRDFAQGRKSSREIRDTFLDALYSYLEENKPNRDLDFIYGSLNITKEATNFIPLDGQQRLTTLFLLHWYLSQISDNDSLKEEFRDELLSDGKSNFTYETRSSSEEFCDALISHDIDFDNLIATNEDWQGDIENNCLSKSLKNRPWYFISWNFDPTVQSMLTMLDTIHYKFKDKKEFFKRLLDLESPIITFLFLNLKDFKLTDDLYIKMNSRGKPLTPFENFKARFEQYLETVKCDKIYKLKIGVNYESVSLKKYFAHSIDTKWADLFWNYKSLQNRGNAILDDTYDDELINFIRVIFTNQYSIDVDLAGKVKDDALEYLLGTSVAKYDKTYSDVISFHKYLELKALSKASVLYLIDAFDSLVNGDDKIVIHLADAYKFYFNEEKAFKNALTHNFESNHARICFHAYLRFLILNKEDRAGINQWMRVVHNLTHPENTVIDNASEVAAAIKSIEELLPHSNNILEYLKTDPQISSFSSGQILEEKIKAHLFSINKTWRNEIEKVEKHKYFNGQIGFILDFSGILEFYRINKSCLWKDKDGADYLIKYIDYADKASKAFEESYDYRLNDVDYVFERAVLSKGDYLTTASQNRKNLLSTNLVKNNIKRGHSWKRLLRISDEEEWSNRRLLVKRIFDDSRFDSENITESLNSICNDKTDSWRDYFISSPKLISYCNQGFIRHDDESKILLYGESQSNHIHAELYTYHAWLNYIEPFTAYFIPFTKYDYKEVKSIEDQPGIVLGDYNYKGKLYEIFIFNYEVDSFCISFKLSNLENLLERFDNEISEAMLKFGFEWDNENDFYSYLCNHEELRECLESLCKKLSDLK